MSYDVLKEKNRRAARDWQHMSSQQEILDDVQRGTFLRALFRSDVKVTPFEASFVESFISMNQLNWWTPGRREVCDCMRKTYGGRL